MKEFFDNYATKALAFVAVIIVGIAWLMGKATINDFLIASTASTGAVAARSIGHAVANKNNHETP
jgi:type IV secretory pathway VirB2 component (pilin)